MHEPSFGLIVEGIYDDAVFPEFVRKVVSLNATVVVRVCGGVSQLMKRFQGLLRDLEHVRQGRPVDKAIVIRDWRGADLSSCEQLMAQRVHGKHFAFPRGVQFCGVRQEMEAWLLADGDAINSVARGRGGRIVPPVRGPIEEIGNPKGMLTSILSQAGVPYDPEICVEIARGSHIDALRKRCPSFCSFEKKVLDC